MSNDRELTVLCEPLLANQVVETINAVITTIEQGLAHQYCYSGDHVDPLGVKPYFYSVKGEELIDEPILASRQELPTIIAQCGGGIFYLQGNDYLARSSILLITPPHLFELTLCRGKWVISDDSSYDPDDPQTYMDLNDLITETFLRALELLPPAVVGWDPEGVCTREDLARGCIPPLSHFGFTIYGPQILARFPAGAIDELVREGLIRIRPLPHGALAIWQEEKVDSYPQYHVERRLGIDLSYLQLD